VIAKKLKLNWPPEGVDLTPVCLVDMGIPNVFYANGTISKSGRPIFLSLNGMLNRESLFFTGEKIGDGADEFSVFAAGKVRRMIIKSYYGGNALDIRSTKDIARLDIDVLRGSVSSSAPRFQLQLDGETSATDILQALYDQGSFIENLGVEVPFLLGKCEFKSGSLEYRFASALALFWKTFEETLSQKEILTFNRAFITLAQAGYDKLSNISPVVLEPFTHLLIDEFQDISPQIVAWLKNIQSYISAHNGNPTIEAIGDDWQSIYGWRGSAPQIFINFHIHFPVHASLGRQNQIMMMTNFRSVGPIVSDAERILAPIEIKIEKKGNCFQQAGPGDHGVILKIADSSEMDGENIIVEEIIKQIKFTDNMQNADKNHVLVLSRTNQLKNKIKASVENRIGEPFSTDGAIQFMTYHQAKGLQGEVAVLCEDCVSGDSHTFRNAIYKASSLFPKTYTYDQAMDDEAYRLGYVGGTRGIRRVLWLVKEAKGASRFFV
jgi:superfamily I DNA/RNA helicase